METQAQFLITICSGLVSVISALISVVAMRQVRRIDKHGTEINNLQIVVQKIDTMIGVMKQQSDLQAIEMKSLNEKFTTFIIDYHKASRTKNRV